MDNKAKCFFYVRERLTGLDLPLKNANFLYICANYIKSNTLSDLLAVSSPTKSIPLASSSTILPDNSNVGGFCCHAGLVLLDGKTGKNLIGSSVPFPLLPRPARPGVNYDKEK